MPVKPGYARKIDIRRGAVEMIHGSGGRATAELIEQLFAEHFRNDWLDQGHDGAVMPPIVRPVAVSCDAHVVKPLFFPGGDIGRLAVCGTVNDVASTLGLSKDPIRAAQEIVGGRLYPLDIGSFGPDRYFTYVAAFGIFTDVPYETPQEDKRIWGRLAYIMNGAGALGRLKPTHVRVYYEGRKEEADVLVGLVTSTTSVGGFKATKDLGISLNDGLYEMILVRATKNLAEFNLAATRALRLDFDNDSFISTQTGALRFEFDEPVSWTVDGEFGGSVTEVEIHNEHRAIDIVVP